MLDIKGNWKTFHSVDYCNGVYVCQFSLFEAPTLRFANKQIKMLLNYFLFALVILVWYLVFEI